MKPCSKNRKLIALLAVDALDAQQVEALHGHLVLCEGCRRYREEISNVRAGLALVTPDSRVEASELFHRQVAEKLQAAETGSFPGRLAGWLRGLTLGWRVVLPVGAAAMIAIFAMVTLRHESPVSPPALPVPHVATIAGADSDLAPTIANYQKAANQSVDALSELLNKQGSKPLPPASIFGMTGFGAANGEF
jgi:hypothetical protein